MTTSFPTGLDALTNPTGSSSLTSPDHAGQHTDANDAIEALEAKVGVDGSAVTTSLDYKVNNINANNITSGTLPDARLSFSGTGVSTGDVSIEMGGARTGSGHCYIDMHAASGTDFESRVLRLAGANGDFSFTNTGTGTMSFEQGTNAPINFKTSSVSRIYVDELGEVGINTTSPAAQLDVQASIGTAMRITNTGTGNSFRVEDASGDTTPFVIDSAGNVGMGTATPAARLHITDGNANIRLNTSTLSADALNIVAPVAGANNRSLTIRPVMNMSASNTLELPNTTGEVVAFTNGRGTNTAWTTFTSTITQFGNVTFNTQVSRYCQMGKLIHWQFSLACTSTGTINNAIRINLPQTAQANAVYSVFGTMHVYDASVNTHYTGHAFAYSTTQAAMMLNGGNTYFQTIPLTAGDIISGHIIYEAA